jgi:hypothetical protein
MQSQRIDREQHMVFAGYDRYGRHFMRIQSPDRRILAARMGKEAERQVSRQLTQCNRLS